MRLPILSFLTLVALLVPANAREFPAYNFAIDLPEGWKVYPPIPFFDEEGIGIPAKKRPQLIADSPDGSFQLSVEALALSQSERKIAASKMRVDLKAAFAKQGLKVEAETTGVIGKQPFVSFAAQGLTGGTTKVITMGDGEMLYVLIATTRWANPSADLKIRAVIESFRLLKPAEPLTLDGP